MMKTLVVYLFVLSGSLCWAQETKNEKIKTLDFEGEVIEGEAMRPMLYLQIESPDLDLNNIIYQRKDFNDFHKIDKVRRNRFIPDQR
ncbi:MAG: hypothetical protein ACK5Y2_04310 [Bdellovibrionales bacterium]